MHLSQPSCRTFLSLRLFWFLMRLLSDRFTVLGQCHSDEYYWGNFTNVISLHNTNTHLSYCDHFCWYIKQLEFYCIAVWCVLVNSQCSSVSTISVSQFSHIFSSILPLPAIKYWYELTSDFSVRAFNTVSAAHLCEQFYWFGHLACKNRPWNDLLCVEWDVKPLHYYYDATNFLRWIIAI